MIPTASVGYIVSQCTLSLNIVILITGILKNPGIPQVYLDRLFKEQVTGKTEQDSGSGSDLENDSKSDVKQRKSEAGKVYNVDL